MNTLADKYYIKALDQYPYSLDEAIENLHYALSHNKEHIGANNLMGKLCLEQLNNYHDAEEYFLIALANDPENMNVCMDYTMLLIKLKEYKKAEKLIQYALGIKGIDISKINGLKGLIMEHQQRYKEALKLYKAALLDAYDEERITQLNDDIKRVKMKKKMVEKSAKKNSKESDKAA
ncbi:tetratricopeptide repeat protein [Puteibacter caeruleilacunae]|nr:tetratricopeptide repeat protein [Puteibacter caeruleilacunae]